MKIVCLDLEGVLVPEVWINFARRTGIETLKATTRDIPDYDELMRMRLNELDKHQLSLPDIQDVISEMAPFDGAKVFIDQLRQQYQLVILSDTFYEFAHPLMCQLGWPTLFCHQLVVSDTGIIKDYQLRLKDHKRKSVEAFQALNFKTIAAGDSYNDTSMLKVAHKGILFQPPQNVIDEFPQFPVTLNYTELMQEIESGFASM